MQGLTGKRVLVTGGAGFIGSHLADALAGGGAAVRVIDNLVTGRRENLSASLERIEFLRGDIRDRGACQEACRDIEIVFHEAALGSVPRSLENPEETFSVNVEGAATVFAAARRAGVRRIVYASSSSVYGDSAVPLKREGEEGQPLSPYAASKQTGELIAGVLARCFSLDVVGLRYFNVYGPRQRADGPYSAVVPRFIQAALAGEPLVIFGDGSQGRDFTFVTDVVRCNLIAANRETPWPNCVYNVGAGRETSVQDLAVLIKSAASSTSAIQNAAPRPGDVWRSVACRERLVRDFGFSPSVSIADGIRRTIEAVRAGC